MFIADIYIADCVCLASVGKQSRNFGFFSCQTLGKLKEKRVVFIAAANAMFPLICFVIRRSAGETVKSAVNLRNALNAFFAVNAFNGNGEL